jgi:hypothetical protein
MILVVNNDYYMSNYLRFNIGQSMYNQESFKYESQCSPMEIKSSRCIKAIE